MNNIQTFLQGKKTYITGAFAVLYAIGAHFKFWPFDMTLFATFGGTGLITIAAKVERLLGDDAAVVTLSAPTAPPVPPGATSKLGVLAFAILSLGIAGVAGCSATLDNGGAYAPGLTTYVTNGVDVTTNFNPTVAPEIALYQADNAFYTAYTIVDAAFLLEHNNSALLWKVSPSIKHTLDGIRPTALKVRNSYAAARTAYIAIPSPANATSLQGYISQIEALASAASAAVSSVK